MGATQFDERARMDGQRLVRLALAFYAVLAGLALAWRLGLCGESPFYAAPAAAAQGAAPLRDLALGALAAAAMVGLSDFLTRHTRSGEALARALARAVGPLSLGQCLVLAGASGVAEEIFFRGALQPRVGLLAASLLFGAAHFVPRRDLALWSVFSVAAGLLLGFLFEATGNLLAPTVAHVGINAVNLPRIVRAYGSGVVR